MSDALKRPLRVIIFGLAAQNAEREEVVALRRAIQPMVEIVCEDFAGECDMSSVEADLAIVLGGDGSILHAAHQMGRRQLPVAAVNLGRLGFLANVSFEEVPKLVHDFAAGKLAVVEHLMFKCELVRQGQVIREMLALNEVTVQTGATFKLLNVGFYVDSRLVTTYRCDGLIISTPVGSTAHALSAGGPILARDLQAVVVVPVSPHTLTNRPLVDSADRVFEMEFCQSDRGETAAVVVDGRIVGTLQSCDRVRVRRAAEPFRMIAAPGHCYYQTLRDKLGWGGRLGTMPD